MIIAALTITEFIETVQNMTTRDMIILVMIVTDIVSMVTIGLGKTEQGSITVFFDTTSSEEEGFLSLHVHPVALTTHARKRLQERLGLANEREMLKHVTDAYRYGKSKRQIKKTSEWMLYEIEQQHDKGILLIYKSYIYVFSKDNVLITVYKNEKVPL